SPTFVLTATGFCLLAYAGFVLLSDVWGREFGVLRTFGLNPLAAYILELFLLNSVLRFVAGLIQRLAPRLLPPEDSWQYGLGFCVAWFVVTYVAVRWLEQRRLFLRL